MKEFGIYVTKAPVKVFGELTDFWKNHPVNEVQEYYAQLLDRKRCKR